MRIGSTDFTPVTIFKTVGKNTPRATMNIWASNTVLPYALNNTYVSGIHASGGIGLNTD